MQKSSTISFLSARQQNMLLFLHTTFFSSGISAKSFGLSRTAFQLIEEILARDCRYREHTSGFSKMSEIRLVPALTKNRNFEENQILKPELP